MIIDTLKMNCGNCKYWEDEDHQPLGRCLAAPGPDELIPGKFKDGSGILCEDGSAYYAALITPKTHSCAEYEKNDE